MLLTIDCGNTNTVFAVFSETGEKRAEWRASTKSQRTTDEYGVWLAHLMDMDNIDRGDIDAAIIASVVPAMLHDLKTMCSRYFSCTPMVVGADDVDLGVVIDVDRPEEVGADRLVNAIAAHKRYGGPLIVLDFGTATTFDVVGATGDYLGGCISPGINLSLEALHMAAAQLPRVAIAKPGAVTGKSTVKAVQSGVYWGYIGLIEGLVKRLNAEHGVDFKVIATGGLAGLFSEGTDVIDHLDKDLTLRGLFEIYIHNATRKEA